MSELDALEEITAYCSNAVRSADPKAREALVDAILSSNKTFIYGSGRSGLIGQLFAVRLVQLGFDVHFVGEMTTPIITDKDLTLLISNTGKTSSVVQTATIAKRVGSKVMCLTGKKDCELTKVCHNSVVFDIPNDTETQRTCPLGSIFEDSAHLFFECIVCDIMERGGITEEDMRSRHAIWV